ncbi:MAG: SgcJ/EcaC family oxidoreductase [Acidobacteriota bacterium]|nr:SgcJ/EcaC family oxidoreductase [Acidobacteriota bacterium]
MYSKITNVVLILMFTVAGICAQEKAKTSGASERDEAMIRANVEQLMKGWNAKSGAEFAKPFAEDADYVIINGMQLKGRPAISEGHQRIFDTIYKNSTLTGEVTQLRFLRPDVAIVHARGVLNVTMPDNSTQSNNARITLVMAKNKDKWEIAAFQNTQIQPPPQQQQGNRQPQK